MFLKHSHVLLRRLQDVQTTIVRFNSATQTQLTTYGHGYSGDTIRQDGTQRWACSVQ
jgi:hypothetical protein